MTDVYEETIIALSQSSRRVRLKIQDGVFVCFVFCLFFPQIIQQIYLFDEVTAKNKAGLTAARR